MSSNMSSTRFQAAMRHPAHLIAMAAIFSLSVALLNIIPALIGIGLEIAYIAASLARAAGVHITVDAPPPAMNDRNSPAGEPVGLPAVRPAGVSGADELEIAFALPPDQDVRSEDPDPTVSGLTSSRQAQLAHLDATYRLIGMRTATGPASMASIGEGLTRMRQTFVGFAKNEAEIEATLRRFSEDAAKDEAERSSAPTSGPSAFVPSMEGLIAGTGASDASASGSDRGVIRSLLAHYDTGLQEIGWQRQHLPPGSRTSQDLEAHAAALLQRRKFAERAGTLLMSLHYEMDMIVRKAESVYSDIGVRQPSHIVSDLNAMLIQGKALSRSLNELGLQGDLQIEAPR